jgi:hypothetical protein
MKRLFFALIVAAFAALAPAPDGAWAQNASRDIARTLDRLDNNPRYRGRILGTHLRDVRGRTLYEVRILRRDDSIVLVYIDPKTGGVVGDSERDAGRANRRIGDGFGGRDPGFSHGFTAPRRNRN